MKTNVMRKTPERTSITEKTVTIKEIGVKNVLAMLKNKFKRDTKLVSSSSDNMHHI